MADYGDAPRPQMAEELFAGLGLLGPALRDIQKSIGDLSCKVDSLSLVLSKKAESADVPSPERLEGLEQAVRAAMDSKVERFELAELASLVDQLSQKCEAERQQLRRESDEGAKELASLVDQLSQKCEERAMKPDQLALLDLVAVHDESISELGKALLEVKMAVASEAPRARDNWDAITRSLDRLPTPADFQALRDAVAAKAEASDVPTPAEFDALSTLVQEQVPHLANQVAALAASVAERDGGKRQSGEAAGAAQERATSMTLQDPAPSTPPAREVHSLRDFEVLGGNLCARMEALEEAVTGKAEASGVPTLDMLEVLSNTVTQQLEVLGNTFASKFRLVDAQLAVKADAASLDALGEALALKADTEWAQEQLEGVTRVLLPVARTVRETMRSHVSSSKRADDAEPEGGSMTEQL